MIALRSKLPKEKLYNRNIREPDYVTAIIFHLSTPRLSLKWMRSSVLSFCNGVQGRWGTISGKFHQEKFSNELSSPFSEKRKSCPLGVLDASTHFKPYK